ncbi:MAG TPA: cupin domain-containing protein [Polyangiaceae bacterium]|nr:cupin domain-containing protein [Polyangiaceae bacterium]
MKSLTPGSELPDFAAEHAQSDAEREILAELFARLGAAPEASAADLARGRARLLAAVAQSDERYAPLFGKLMRFFDLSAEALRAIFERAANAADWEPGPVPGVSLFHFQGGPGVAGFDTGFVRFKKGMPHPLHRHLGDERVLVLEGGYFDHEQRWYGPGDFHDMSAGSEHSLQMSTERDVLLAVVMAGPIEILGG